ncbi:hypothetical protein SAMN05443247_06550 [Bradyrhizobium erythrophlei]|nr:hypothetical protein SAMN05443247_06550 [Bradyrhizobium erythrophlei]
MTDKTPAPNTAEAQLAKSNEQKAHVLAQQIEREKWMPTPTQHENDAQAMGMPVEKKPDGSPVEETPEQQRTKQLEAKKPEGDTRHMEAGRGAGYQTRSAG